MQQQQRHQHQWPWTLMDPRGPEYARYEAHEFGLNEASRASRRPLPSPRGGLLALSHHVADMAVIEAYRLDARPDPGFYFFEIHASAGDDGAGAALPPRWVHAADMMSWLAFNCPHASVAAALCLNVHAHGGLCTCAILDAALGDVRFYAVGPSDGSLPH